MNEIKTEYTPNVYGIDSNNSLHIITYRERRLLFDPSNGSFFIRSPFLFSDYDTPHYACWLKCEASRLRVTTPAGVA